MKKCERCKNETLVEVEYQKGKYFLVCLNSKCNSITTKETPQSQVAKKKEVNILGKP